MKNRRELTGVEFGVHFAVFFRGKPRGALEAQAEVRLRGKTAAVGDFGQSFARGSQPQFRLLYAVAEDIFLRGRAYLPREQSVKVVGRVVDLGGERSERERLKVAGFDYRDRLVYRFAVARVIAAVRGVFRLVTEKKRE